MDKADYVRSQGQTRVHHCHWPGCQVQVPPAMWGCRRHWFTLPHQLRAKIWKAYVPGQEITMTPSDEYLEVATEVQQWIANHERGSNAKRLLQQAGKKRIPKHTVRYRSCTFGSLKCGSTFKASKKQQTWWQKKADDLATSINGELRQHWSSEDLVWIEASGSTGSGQSL